MIAGIEGSFWRWLFEEIGKHLGLEGLKWLLKHPLVLMRIDLPIGVWMVLAVAVIILVVVSAVGLVKIRPFGERALGGEHIWAGVFWALIIVAILAFYYAWR